MKLYQVISCMAGGGVASMWIGIAAHSTEWGVAAWLTWIALMQLAALIGKQ